MNLRQRVSRAVRIRQRLYWHSRWANGNYVSDTPAIVIGGSVRSGTTLLRTMLDSHPNIAAGPESWLFVYRVDYRTLASNYQFSFEEVDELRRRSTCLSHFIDLFLEEYARRMGKTRWVEKSPANVIRLKYVWRHFPHARFIHMIRDGRDVVCSIRSQQERLHRKEMTSEQGILDQRLNLWKSHVSAGIAWRGDRRYLEVRYEDLVKSPREVMATVLGFVGEPWFDDVLRPHEYQLNRPHKITERGTPEVHKPIFQNSVGRWRRDLSPAESQRCWRKAGELLETLGYAQ